jgi:hypothetical protein
MTHHSVIWDTSGMYMRVQLLNTPFLIKAAAGRLRPTWIAIDQGVGISTPLIGGNFGADSITVNLDTLGVGFFTAAGPPIDFSLSVYGYRSGRFVDSIQIPANAASVQPGMFRYLPGQNNVVTLSGPIYNAFLRKFQSNTPDSLRIHGVADIDPIDAYSGGYHATISDTMNLYAEANVMLPMSVAIYKGEFFDDQAIGQEDSAGHKAIDPTLLSSIISGKLNLSIDNTFPFHLMFQGVFIDTLAQDTLIRLDSLAVRPGIYTQTLRLSRAQSIYFAKANKFHAALYIDTQDTTATLTPTERIRLKISGTIVFNVNPDKLKND